MVTQLLIIKKIYVNNIIVMNARLHNIYISVSSAIISSAAVLTLLPSCTSLDENPASYVVTKNFYMADDDADAAVKAVYAALIKGGTSEAQSLYNRGIQLATETTTDDCIAGPRAYNANVQALSRLAHDASNDRAEALWRDSYRLINLANIAVDKIGQIGNDKITDAKRAQYTGEAKFLRALSYFNLVRWFEYVPLVLHEVPSLSSAELYPSQAPEDSVYAQIERDLKDAELLLPEPSAYSEADAGRATAGSAKALLAKVYLTRKQWQQAAEKSKEIIDLGWYSLFDDYRDVFNPATQNGKEHIFSIQFTGNTGIVSHMLAISEATYEVPGVNGQHYDAYNTQSNLYDSFEEGDKRKDVTFVTEMVSPANGKTYKLSEPHFNKYYDYTSVGSQTNSSVNIPVLRYSDVLLMYAEALNEINGGPTGEAYAAIDQVRKRAGVRPLSELSPSLQQDSFREAVFEERRKEFAYEYNRWFDLSRRGADYFVSKVRAAGKQNAAPRHIHLPIPQRELDLNKNLKQNPDWVNY